VLATSVYTASNCGVRLPGQVRHAVARENELRPRQCQHCPTVVAGTASWKTSGATGQTPPMKSSSSTTRSKDGRDNPEHYRLLTTILDPDQAKRDPNSPVHTRSVGNRERLRRNEIPSARDAGGAALEVPALRAAGDFGGNCAAITRSGRPARRRTHAGTTPIEYPCGGAGITRRSLSHSSFSPSNRGKMSPPSGSAPPGNSPNASIQHAAPRQPKTGVVKQSLKWAAKRSHTRDGRNRPTSPKITLKLLKLNGIGFRPVSRS